MRTFALLNGMIFEIAHQDVSTIFTNNEKSLQNPDYRLLVSFVFLYNICFAIAARKRIRTKDHLFSLGNRIYV